MRRCSGRNGTRPGSGHSPTRYAGGCISTCARSRTRSAGTRRPRPSAWPGTRRSSTSTGWRSDGLLDSEFARLSGRSGPGAGRTSKLYRRADREIAVSLPDREYQLAGRLLADSVAESVASGEPVLDVLHRHAAAHGRTLGRTALAATATPESATSALRLATRVLAGHGYEPRPEGERVVLANCPFHALAKVQTELVCHMNEALVAGVAATLGPHCPQVTLDPKPGRCCVVLAEGAS